MRSLYECFVIPFGLCINARMTFMHLMNGVLHPSLVLFLIVYAYDILIYGTT